TEYNADDYLPGRPQDALNQLNVQHRNHALGATGIDRTKLDGLGRAPLELAHRQLAVLGLDRHAVAAADRGIGRNDEDGAVPIGGLQRIAGNLERIGVLVVDGRERNLVAAIADRNPGIVEGAAIL